MKFRKLEYVLLFSKIFQVFGSLHNLPCRRTVDIDKYDLQCQTYHSIYIVNHVIEDGFERLSQLDVLFGCNVENSLVCGQHYPINSTISGIFQRAISTCNGKNMCTLSKQYFEDSENLFRSNCPSLQSYPNTMVRQSIEYECIPETERSVIDMCTYLNVSREGNLYLKADGGNKICMCEILGTVSGLLILRSYKTGITTNPRFQNTPESKQFSAYDNKEEETEKEGDTVYGRNLSIRSDRISITVNLTSLESMVFLKVLIEENAASVARAESLIFHDPSTIDTTKKSTNKNYTKPGFLKSLLSTTESADLSSNVQVNTDFGTHQGTQQCQKKYHGWLVTGTILVFLVVTSLFIWKFKPGKNKMMSTDTSDSTKKGKNLTSVENIERNNSAIQISSEMSHRVVYTSLISSTDQTEDYEEPIHFPLPQSNVYIEILPDLKWSTKEIEK